jgi:hypothetical protein
MTIPYLMVPNINGYFKKLITFVLIKNKYIIRIFQKTFLKTMYL